MYNSKESAYIYIYRYLHIYIYFFFKKTHTVCRKSKMIKSWFSPDESRWFKSNFSPGYYLLIFLIVGQECFLLFQFFLYLKQLVVIQITGSQIWAWVLFSGLGSTRNLVTSRYVPGLTHLNQMADLLTMAAVKFSRVLLLTYLFQMCSSRDESKTCRTRALKDGKLESCTIQKLI